MSLIGIDVGTTRCKTAAYSETGALIAAASAEYDIQSRQPGWAELDSAAVWDRVKGTIAQVAARCHADPPRALAVSSLGEAMVPVTANREILGASILKFDVRGEEYVARLREGMDEERVYRIAGATFGNDYGLTKLVWLRDHQPTLYHRADLFLLWGSFVPFMLGAEPVVDYSLANRTLLFDLDRENWSEELLSISGLDRAKLPRTVPAGTVCGRVSDAAAAELGLPRDVAVIAGSIDQCSAAVGSGVLDEGQSLYVLGTFICITVVYCVRRPAAQMIERGLNTEHHALPGRYISFIANLGGAGVKWFRDTFAAVEHRQAAAEGRDIYDDLFREMPEGPSPVLVYPEFMQGANGRGAESRAVIAGLDAATPRGAVLRGIVEGSTFDLQCRLETLPSVWMEVKEFRVGGGGSRSDRWLQLSADILDRPFVRTNAVETGTLGNAILAGAGCGVFRSVREGVEALVRTRGRFEPDPKRVIEYRERFQDYLRLCERLGAG